MLTLNMRLVLTGWGISLFASLCCNMFLDGKLMLDSVYKLQAHINELIAYTRWFKEIVRVRVVDRGSLLWSDICMIFTPFGRS